MMQKLRVVQVEVVYALLHGGVRDAKSSDDPTSLNTTHESYNARGRQRYSQQGDAQMGTRKPANTTRRKFNRQPETWYGPSGWQP